MEISNPSDITYVINMNMIRHYGVSDFNVSHIMSNCTSRLYGVKCADTNPYTLYIPFSEELEKYLFIKIEAAKNQGKCTISLSLWCTNPDDSAEYMDAQHIITEYLKSVYMPRDVLTKHGNDGNLVYDYMDITSSIDDVIKYITNLITNVVNVMQTYYRRKKPISWDDIDGMHKGSVVYLTDNGNYDVKDNNDNFICATYLGDNKLQSNCYGIVGSPSALANIFINNYGNRTSRVYDMNGDECWTFNGKRICDCNIKIK